MEKAERICLNIPIKFATMRVLKNAPEEVIDYTHTEKKIYVRNVLLRNLKQVEEHINVSTKNGITYKKIDLGSALKYGIPTYKEYWSEKDSYLTWDSMPKDSIERLDLCIERLEADDWEDCIDIHFEEKFNEASRKLMEGLKQDFDMRSKS